MANRSFRQPLGCLEVDMVTLYASVAIGSTGAPTLSTVGSKGISSISRDSAGQYKVYLQDSYSACLFANSVNLSTAASAQTDGLLFRMEDDQSAAATPYIQIQYSATADGADADVKSGQTVLLKFDLRNSSVTGA